MHKSNRQVQNSQRSLVLTSFLRMGELLVEDLAKESWTAKITSFRADGSFVLVVRAGVAELQAVATYFSMKQDTANPDMFDIMVQEAFETYSPTDTLSRTTKTVMTDTLHVQEINAALNDTYVSFLGRFLTRLSEAYSH